MTSHETYREQLLDLAYGELGKREARALRAHLESCAACRDELARITGTRTAMSALGNEPAPERGQAILLAAAREAARERRPRQFLPSWVWGATMGAVGVAAVVVLSLRFADLVQSPTDRHGATEVISRSAPEPSEDKSAVPQAPAAAPAVQPAEPGAEPAPSKGGAEEPSDVEMKTKVERRPIGEKRAVSAPAAKSAAPGGPGKKEASRPEQGASGGAALEGGRFGGTVAGELGHVDQPAKAKKDAGPNANLATGGGAGSVRDERQEAPKPVAPPRTAKGPESPATAAAKERADRDERTGVRLHGYFGNRAGEDLTLDEYSARDGAVAQAERESVPPAEPPATATPPTGAASDAATAAAKPSEQFAKPPPVRAAPEAERSRTSDRKTGKSESVARTDLAAPQAAGAASEDAVARYERLRSAGQLRVASAAFQDCPGESFRQVELDPAGRVVKLTRRGAIEGAPYQAELFYGEDGALGAVRLRSGSEDRLIRVPPTGAAGAGKGPLALEPGHAAEARLDAPPRCR